MIIVVFNFRREKMKTVQKVYVGKANKCFCGCSGKWFDANKSDDLT